MIKLTQTALDWAVATAEGLPKAVDSSGLDGPVIVCGFEQEMLHSRHRKGQEWKAYQPSTNWAQGGPIIEREKIGIECDDQGVWFASYDLSPEQAWGATGPTALIAAMRCYVEAKLGDEVETGICDACSGSGEGQYDGTTCRVCKGRGEC